MFKNYEGLIIESIVTLIMTACMSLVGTLLSAQDITFGMFFTSWGQAFLLNYLANIIISTGGQVRKICKMFHLKENEVKTMMVSNLIYSIVNTTIISLGMTYLNVGFGSSFIPAWLSMYPVMFVVSYIVSFIAGGFAKRYAVKMMENRGDL